MPNKSFNFSVGCAAGLSVAFFIYQNRRWLFEHTQWMKRLYEKERSWVLYLPLLGICCGIWALIPDALFSIGIVTKEWSHGPYSNIFFFHGVWEEIEHLDPAMDKRLCFIGNAALAVFYVSCMTGYSILIIRLQRKIRESRWTAWEKA